MTRFAISTILHACAVLAGSALLSSTHAAEPIKIGLVTALSGQSAQGGEAIARGLGVAIDEINARGGIAGGRKLELVSRDDESNPAKGVIAARELIYKDKVSVIFGGLDTPVSMALVPLMNQTKTPFMGPWAAGTGITRNGANPNYVFRVSAVDELVDRAMVQYAQKTFNSSKAGLILVNNPWGESNEKGLMAALAEKGTKPAGAEKFEGNDVDIVPQLTRLRAAGADTLYLVGNVGPAAQVVKSLERMDWKVPIVSHWGPATGRFTELAGPNAKNVHFVQTYSFFGKQSPQGEKVIAALRAKYPAIKGAADIAAAIGVANAYDGMHLVAKAIALKATADREAIRDGLEQIDRHEGLIKTYVNPFSPTNHDALNENDYVWARFIDNQILPVDLAK
jgi:branched-chain amino acid transport system substrate-binding protein